MGLETISVRQVSEAVVRNIDIRIARIIIAFWRIAVFFCSLGTDELSTYLK
jgi:hypothetical protein